MANFELQTRVPMMIRAPWIKTSVGVSTTALAELVDMYPTALELAGLPIGLALSEHLEGTSLVPVLRDPSVHLKVRAVRLVLGRSLC
jgi:iduronate 2-sulfatase